MGEFRGSSNTILGCIRDSFLAPTVPSQAQCLIETVVDGGTAATGDGGPAIEAELQSPTDVRTGPDGLVYIADWGRHRVRRIAADGRLETIAGTGVDAPSGDGGPAANAGLHNPLKLAFGPDGSLYILEAGPAVRVAAGAAGFRRARLGRRPGGRGGLRGTGARIGSGIVQVNRRLPAGLTPGPARVLLTIGEQSNATRDASVLVGQ